MTIHRVTRKISFGRARCHALAAALLQGGDDEFRWLRIGRLNVTWDVR